MFNATHGVNNIKKRHEGHIKILNVLDAGSFFIYCTAPEQYEEGDRMYDGLYSMDKKTGKIKGFSPLMDIDAFTNAKPVQLNNTKKLK